MTDENQIPQPGAHASKKNDLQRQIDDLRVQLERQARTDEKILELLEQLHAKLDFVLPDETRILSLSEITEYLKVESDAEFEVAKDFARGDYIFAKGRRLRAAGMPGLKQLVGAGLQLVIPVDRSEAAAKLRMANKVRFQALIARQQLEKTERATKVADVLEQQAAQARANAEAEAAEAAKAIEAAKGPSAAA